MNTPGYNDPEFDQVINNGYAENGPYGPPVHYAETPVKTGLTPRGKAALGVGTAFLACGSLFGWQHYSAQQATAEAKAQELALKQQELRLLEIREMNKVNTAQAETQAATDKARQKKIDACVNNNKALVGKQMGATYRSVLEDCQAQYPATTSSDMQAVATTDTSSGGGINTGLLIGGGILAVGLAAAVKKSTKPTPA